jgi:hypothetical protein
VSAEHRLLHDVQRRAFAYFAHETSTSNGLVKDTNTDGAPSSIAAVGLALTSYPAAVERGFVSRDTAVARVLATLRFFWRSKQGPEPDATGYRGFYYHFLDMTTGARTWHSELSTVDSALLIAGMLVAGAYFDGVGEAEREIRQLSERLYARVDWQWALDGGSALSHGWTPEKGFLPYRWRGYDEALVIHQLSHVWIDFRGIQDAFMRAHDCDYFENSRRATLVQQQYAIRNPGAYVGYDAQHWGITASTGPGDVTRTLGGVSRTFFGYLARGAPDGPDDGSLSPWGVIASLPFAPEIVLPAIESMRRLPNGGADHLYGVRSTYNPTFVTPGGPAEGWVSPYHCGLNQGPIVAMIENHRSGLVWQLLRGNSNIVAGLRAAGFTGGWLANAS